MEKSINSVDHVSDVYQTNRVHPSNQSEKKKKSKSKKNKFDKQKEDVVILTSELNNNIQSDIDSPKLMKKIVGSTVDVEA